MRRARRLHAIGVLAMVGLMGCIEPGLVPCGDQLCPAGTTCVRGDGRDRCATAEQLAACDGVAEGSTCTVGGGVGRCDSGVCVATGCGNGVVDPDETCDDGNAVGGDGCSADCGKLEVCGDGILDDGEACDDADSNPADGCDACGRTTWRASAVVGGSLGATTVGLANPSGVAVDRFGNVYIADSTNHRIRRVDVAGVITTVAGTGVVGSSGDGGVATSAQLAYPRAVAVDGLGNVYIADTNNHRIRRVDDAGVITTFAGTGVGGTTGDGGAATSAQLTYPSAVAVDGLGDVYIGDASYRVRRVDIDGSITTVAGTGVPGYSGDGGAAIAAQFTYPADVAIDGLGSLYIADTYSNRVRRVDAAGVITTVAGTGTAGASGDGGVATSAQLAYPSAVAVDGLGNLYIADGGNHRIRRVDASGVITTVAGTGALGSGGDGGAAINAELSTPAGVAVDGLRNVYIADATNERIRRVDPAGVIFTVAGTGALGSSGDGAAATSARLSTSYGVALDGLGNIYIADTYNHRIARVDVAGVITTVAGTGVLGDGGDGGAATSAQLQFPFGVAVDGLGSVYIADSSNHRIRRVNAAGVITTIAGTGASGYSGDGGLATSAEVANPFGVAVDGLGNVYIADRNNYRIRRVDAAGVITTVAGTGITGFSGDGGAATSAQIASPNGLAIDGLGNLYFADAGNDRIRRVDAAGIITTVAGTGAPGFSGDGGAATSAQLRSPEGVALDGLGGLYIADSDNHRIRRVDPAGVITTIAGTGTGFGGDGAVATSAQLMSPASIAVDGLGNRYIADRGNSRIRRVDPAGVITTIAGTVDPEGTGPSPRARLADPRALVVAPMFTLFAGGTSGTVELARPTPPWLEVAIGRYPQTLATGPLARFRDQSFGEVAGVAYDAAAGVVYLSESTANRLHIVTVVDAAKVSTWTIAALNLDTTGGFADGALATAKFRDPTGLYLDAVAHQLYVADTGNHVVRVIDLSSGIAGATVRTVAGTPATRGLYGDGQAATAALLYAPRAITRCPSGDVFVADTGNHRIRRIAVATGAITTVLGDGVAASSGEGEPAASFPVNAPLGLGCDALGNLYVTSTTTVRLVPADASGVVDGTGGVQTIYGAPPRDTFPASVTTCLTGLAVVDATTIEVVDACTGLLVELRRGPAM